MSALKLIQAILLELERKKKTDETIQIFPYSSSSVSTIIENKNENFYELTVPDNSNIDLIDLTLTLRMLAASHDQEGPFSNAIYKDNKIIIPAKAINESIPQEKLPNKYFHSNLSNTTLTSEAVIQLYSDDAFTKDIQNDIYIFITNNINHHDNKLAEKNARLLMLGSFEFNTDLINFINNPQFSVTELYGVFNEFPKESQERIIRTLCKLTVNSNNAVLKIKSGFICQFLIAYYKNSGDLQMTTHILLIANLNHCNIPPDPENEILIKIARLTKFNVNTQEIDFFSALKTNDTFFQMSLDVIMDKCHYFSQSSYFRLKGMLENESTGLSKLMESQHCITLKNMLKNYMRSRPVLSHKDKIALYYMIQPYMDNPKLCKKLHTFRPLAASLREFYNNLRRDVIDSNAIELYKNVYGVNSVSQVLQMSQLSNSIVDAQTSTTHNNNNDRAYSLSEFSAK